MERLWAPWRSAYVTAPKPHDEGCIFCDKAAAGDDSANYIVHRAQRCFVMLNAYPYNVGHLMIAPYAHVSDLEGARPEDLAEMMLVTRRAERVFRQVMNPDAFNLGMNVGKPAGAGVAGHIHLHIVPRWTGDTNFMPVFTDTRVMSQSLDSAYEVLRRGFAEVEG